MEHPVPAGASQHSADHRYRVLFDSIDEGLCVIEVQFDANGHPSDYLFLETNAVFERQTGLVNAVGRTARELVPDLEPHWFEIYGRVATSREPIRFVNGSDAMHRWFDVYALPIDEPELNHVAVLFTDITERRRHQLDLEFLADIGEELGALDTLDQVMRTVGFRLAQHLSVAACALVEVDEPAGTASIDYAWAREGLPDPRGRFEVRDLILATFPQGRGAADLLAIGDVAADPRPAVSQLRRRGIRALASVPLFRDGQWRFTLLVYDDRPRVWRDGELELLRELTARIWPRLERGRSEAAIRESEERFRTMADNAPVMIWVTEPDGRCTYLNRRWYEFTGQTPETALGFGWLDAVHEDDRAGAKEAFIGSNQEGAQFRHEYRLRRQDGTYAWAIDSAAPRRGPAGEFLGYVGSVIDIAERRAMEEELRAANRLKDEFLATLSHELRTPLNAVVGWAHMLRTGTVSPEMQQRALESLERNARTQAQLVNDLLDVSRTISGKLHLNNSIVDITTIVAQAIDTVTAAAAGKDITIEMTCVPRSEILVSGDPDRLRQVMWNLLSNAVKFTPAGGRVEVDVRTVAGEAEIVVRDSGQGISQDFLPLVFERFRQADASVTRRHGGLGIGLSIVRHLVEAHGGSVSASSGGLDQGATFVVRLRLGPEDRRRSRLRPAGEMPVSLSGARVLVVDDHADSRDLVAAILGRLGAQVREADTVRRALVIAAEGDVDVVLADLGMPEEDGFTLIRAIRQSSDPDLRRLPVVALTAYAGSLDRAGALDAGFDRHVAKPVEPAMLVRVVGELLTRS